MLFKKLVLENYKIYFGRQELNFDISSQSNSPYRKNLILVGGLNGAGKTTILDAIHYALFGQQGLSTEDYSNQFTSSINDHAFDKGIRESSLELTIEDEDETITITVTWSFDSNKKLINENRVIYVHKVEDGSDFEETYNSTEEYLDFINRRIPYEVAPFFIFDGEKIQDLVQKQDQKTMKDSIQRIVSLEMYKTLVEDLNKIQTSLERKLNTNKSNKQLSSYKSEIEEADSKIEKYGSKLKEFEENIKDLESKRTTIEQDRRRKLAQNTKSSIQVAERLKEYETKLEGVNDDLEKFAQKNLKDLILSSSIKKLQSSLREERNYLEKKTQEESLRKAKFASLDTFLHELFNTKMNPALSEDHKEQIKTHGETIWERINSIPKTKLEERSILHDLSPKDREKILYYSHTSPYNVKELINEKNQLERLISTQKSNLENAPDPVDTAKEDQILAEIQEQLGELYHRRKQYTVQFRKQKENAQNLRNQAKRIRETQRENSEAEKQYDYVCKMKDAASEFVEEMTQLKATQIRTEFQNILEKLTRKGDDFDEVEFNEDDFVIRIFNDRGSEIQLNTRSAGEKQIIALSFIWALTKTAGLSLPFVIDTPLGRLDSIHRNHIIRNYFNALSDQVIILSTDTEVNHEYIDFVKNYMVRGYELVYDEQTKSSVIKEGYFAFN